MAAVEVPGHISIVTAALVLDVRPDLAAGREPMTKILAAARSVRPNGDLVVLVPFEPIPLYSVLARLGFSHAAQPIGALGYRVTFRRDGAEEGLPR